MGIVDGVIQFRRRVQASKVSDAEFGLLFLKMLEERNRKGWPHYTLRSLIGIEALLNDLTEYMELDEVEDLEAYDQPKSG